MNIYENYKVVVIGSIASGKSSFINRLDNKGFNNQVITIGVNTITRKTKIGEIDVNITIWDTAGQEKFSSLAPSYFKSCHGVFIFYDVNDQNSFDQVKSWNRQIEQSTDIPPVKVLIAAKCDSATRLIDSETGISEASSIGATYFETSSKENKGIEAFDHIAKELAGSQVHSVVVIGSTGAGKSSFINRLGQNEHHNQFTTIGIDFRNRRTKVGNKNIKMRFWDTPGIKISIPMIRSYLANTHGVFIVYDVGDLSSFEEVDMRNREIDQYSRYSPAKVLIAAKCDLGKSKRVVDTNMGKEKAESIGAAYLEISALENIGIKEAFDHMVKETSKKLKSASFIIKPNQVEPPSPNEKSCC